ncbi:FecR family protein [Dyadobacter sp. SG02]|uniref:FecR family protein n=1 Tax=Dyadobacter sp. SG02 TaxID=1855291 RepID=UPI0008BC9713|nr:FecR domain-containing protein [Dyadobacter sp. SG02]SEJ01359.1 FecR family protein [Dyadobacter sp. SG02]
MKYYKDYDLEDFLQDDSFRRWVAGEADATEGLWEEIVRLYPDKKVIMQQARELVLTWQEHSAIVTDQQLEDQVQRILHTTQAHTEVTERRFAITKYLSVAAAAAALVSGLTWFYFAADRDTTRSGRANYPAAIRPDSKTQELVNNLEKEMRLRLPDSSEVRLSPGARITYSQNFVHNKKREVFLSGEAFFDVTKDPQNPFFVYANGLVTRVLGTSFLVKATDTNVEVLVRSGRVSVLPLKDIENPTDRNTELLLTPNQQAIFSVKDNVISKSITNMPLELIKPDAEAGFVFENQPVSKVFYALEKVYGIPIVYDAAVMEKCSLRVELSNEPFFTKLDIITQTLGAAYRVSDGQVVISSEGCR